MLSDAERMDVVGYLAANPRAGDLMQGTGGVRKLHSEAMPLYLLTVFGKGDRANLTKAERNDLAELVRVLKATVERRH